MSSFWDLDLDTRWYSISVVYGLLCKANPVSLFIYLFFMGLVLSWTMGNLGRAGFGASVEGLVWRFLHVFCDLFYCDNFSGRIHMTPVMSEHSRIKPILARIVQRRPLSTVMVCTGVCWWVGLFTFRQIRFTPLVVVLARTTSVWVPVLFIHHRNCWLIVYQRPVLVTENHTLVPWEPMEPMLAEPLLRLMCMRRRSLTRFHGYVLLSVQGAYVLTCG